MASPKRDLNADELTWGRSYEQGLALWLKTTGYHTDIREFIARTPTKTSDIGHMEEAGEMLRDSLHKRLAEGAYDIPAGFVVMLRYSINRTDWARVARFLALDMSGHPL